MRLKDQILELLAQPDYTPVPAIILGKLLGIQNGALQEQLIRDLATLTKRGQIVKIKKGRYCLPQDADLVSGIIRFRASGSALVLPDPIPGQAKPDPLHIRAEDTSVAMPGDRVIARKMKSRSRAFQRRRKGRPPRKEPDEIGKIIEIVERKHSTVVGTLRRGRHFYFVVPDNPTFQSDIVVPDPDQSSVEPLPQAGDKVVVKLEEWTNPHQSPEGVVIENLGKTLAPGAEYRGILRKFDLEPEFPQDVLQELESLPGKVRKEDLKGRQDFTKRFTFTIDPDDAKDFDDAISVEYLDDGKIRLGVHIADVSAYVKPGTALDREAQRRGNSTYLVGTVIPMLPEKLSNGLCSLVEDEIRLTKSVLFTFSKDCVIRKTEYANSYIRSFKRLTYKQAYCLMTEDDIQAARDFPLPPKHQTGSTGRALKDLSDQDLQKLQQAVRDAWKIASHLRKKRFAKGSLELDMPEMKIFVDEAGYADRIERIENDESHQLIEEFMLSANEAVARETKKNRLPSLYRVHEKPDEQKLYELSETMESHGLHTGDLTSKMEVVKLLKNIKDHSYGYTLRIQVLRALKQACYSAEPLGHYGLHKSNYTHFTSPIRRYSDLIVHRVFAHFLTKYKGAPALDGSEKTLKKDRMDSLAEHVSQTEQNSTEAERESVKIKQMEFFERESEKREKTVFQAAILETRNHGMFVELVNSLTFGLVPVSSMTDDLYVMLGDGQGLIGRRNKRKFVPGQTISVTVSKVDRFKRQIDFVLAEEGKATDGDKHEVPRSNEPKYKKAFDSDKPKNGKSKSGGRSKRPNKQAMQKPTKKTAKKPKRRNR